MEKRDALRQLEHEIENDITLPLREANLVFGEGDINAKILFIGEAPGQKENELRRPFVGRSGQLFTKILEEAGIARTGVYITNIVKRRPPENRDPSPQEIEAYKPYLTRQIEILHPMLVATLGRFSMNYFLPDAKISHDQGKLFKVNDYFVYPIYHPAAALRSTTMLAAFRKSIERLPEALKKCEERKSK
ncbi:MAG: uracil-DNA glycosylase [Candidatus Paceibacterota bacterium]|jgi:DNA polymerase